MTDTYTLKPIGQIVAAGGRYALQLAPACAPALDGLAGFSHLSVLWWAHLLDDPELRALLVADSPYRDAPPQLGLFATRAPMRPNPICHTVVSVLALDAARGRVELAYIDAEDGTPLLDIKPYHPCTDRVRETAVPGWCAGWPQWLEDTATFDWTAVFDNAR